MGVQVPLMGDKRPSADVCHYFGWCFTPTSADLWHSPAWGRWAWL